VVSTVQQQPAPQHRFLHASTRTVEILRGGRSKVVAKYGYDELPGYGDWNDWHADELLGEVDAMLAAGVIRSTGGRFPKLELAA
jgi:ATP-dependent DNA helicase RecQ